MNRPASSAPPPRRRLRFVGGLVASVAALLMVIAACSNQGEGERCEVNNNNADCDTSAGLICWRGNDLNTNSDRCCPADWSRATHPVCRGSTRVGDTDTPADTGPPPAPVNDGAATDAPSDDGAAPADGGADASDADPSDADPGDAADAS